MLGDASMGKLLYLACALTASKIIQRSLCPICWSQNIHNFRSPFAGIGVWIKGFWSPTLVGSSAPKRSGRNCPGASLVSKGAKLANAVAQADRTSPAESAAKGKTRQMTSFLRHFTPAESRQACGLNFVAAWDIVPALSMLHKFPNSINCQGALLHGKTSQWVHQAPALRQCALHHCCPRVWDKGLPETRAANEAREAQCRSR